ncbi:MAG: RnfABCDGE type electron transport complex subunit G [Bacteroidales bacterium]
MSEKKESSFLNMFVSLTLICVLSGAILAGAYLLTKDKIASAASGKAEAAIRLVLPEFDKVEEKVVEVNGEKIVCSLAYKSDVMVGIAVQSTTKKGYGGEFKIMAGLLPSGEIHKIKVLKHGETPGLGAKIETDVFLNQFQGKNPANYKLQVKKDGGDVDAVSAATISSRAFCDALNKAYQVVLIEKGEQK